MRGGGVPDPTGAQWAQKGGQVTLATATQEAPPAIYSGFSSAIARWGTGIEEDIERNLKWQMDVDGETTKIKQFQEVAGSLQDYRTYLFIKPGSAFATVLHSPIKFVALTEGTQHLQGRFIGFVWDRTMARDPNPIILPQEKTWKWKTQRCSTNPTAFEDYYKYNTTRRGKLWSPDLSEDDEEIQVPHLLSIPLILFSTIRAEG